MSKRGPNNSADEATTLLHDNGTAYGTSIEPQISNIPRHSNKTNERKLDTFTGVFIPTSLNILSILMFLRFGFIVGQAGILGALGLLILSYTIDSLTVMSVSAIATNGTVKGGGAYYMISRSLGPEFGGAIGIIFFIGQILNSSLNVVGFIEPLLVNFGRIDGDLFQLLPVGYFWQLLYSTLLLALCTGIALVGSKLVSKTALWLFLVLLFSTLTIPLSSIFVKPFYPLPAPDDNIFYTGLSFQTFKQNLLPHFTSGAAGSVQPIDQPETFRNMFGIFFPATAGIFAGASMSGELKNPSKSIPQGTIRGLLITFCLYAIVIVSLGSSIPRNLLYKDIKVIQTVNIQGYIIILGELSTSLFSVIMGIVGSASLLTAISNDKIIPGLTIFSNTKKTDHQKQVTRRISILATWFLAQLFLFADINQIATFITMAFLMTFMVTNLACLLLKIGSAPNFRPSFKYFSSKTAFFGLLTSVVAMFIVDGMSASMVIILLLVLIILIHYTTPPLRFGDISQLLIYHQVRKYLLRLKLNMSVKYWRPQILLLCDNPRSSWNLIGFCNHLKKGGLYILGHVVILNDDTKSHNDKENDIDFSVNTYKEVQKQKAAWVKLRDMSKIKAFVQIAIGPSLPWGVRNVYLGSGLGGMRPNITVLGFYDFVKHGLELPTLSSFKNKSKLFNQLPTDECREEQKVSINQWVQIIEDLIIMQATVAVSANFNSLDLPKVKNPHFWSQPSNFLKDDPPKKYIDLYPIQMSSINHTKDGKSVLSTNFDTYTLILQLGSILSTVPEWKYSNHRLRIIVFVENKSEIEDERSRLVGLISSLRIEAKVKVVCLDDLSLNSYNYIVRGYSKNASNKLDYDRIDKTLKNDQWWKNLTNARNTLKELEKQKLSRKKKAQQQQEAQGFPILGLNNAQKTGNDSFEPKDVRNRRYTISNLHDRGLSLSFNMKSQGGAEFFKYELSDSDNESDSFSEDEDEDEDEDNDISDEEPEYINNGLGTDSPVNASSLGRLARIENSPMLRSGYNSRLNLNSRYKDQLELGTRSSDQVSIRSSRSNLRPNFVSVKTPQAQIHDNDDDDEDEGDEGDEDKPSIGFVNDDASFSDVKSNEKTPSEIFENRNLDYFSLKFPDKRLNKKSNNPKLKNEKSSNLGSPSIISNDDGIIHQMKTPQFRAADDDDANIPSLPSSTTNLPGLETSSSQHPRGGQSGSAAHRTNVYKKSQPQQKDQRVPSEAPSEVPSEIPSEAPSEIPSEAPSEIPSEDIQLDSQSQIQSQIQSETQLETQSQHSPSQPDTNSQPLLTQKQLQQELKEISFDDIPAKGQHIILNELMKLNSPKDQTDVIFSTLPAPPLNTHLHDDDSFEYTNNLSIWINDLPPILLFNSQTVTVTTAL